jgi:hypothetical protein
LEETLNIEIVAFEDFGIMGDALVVDGEHEVGFSGGRARCLGYFLHFVDPGLLRRESVIGAQDLKRKDFSGRVW